MFATLLQATGAGDKLVTPEVPWSHLAPQLILVVGATVGVIAAAALRGRLRRSVGAIGAAVVAGAAIVSIIPLWHRVSNPAQGPISAVNGAIGVDRFSLFVTALLCIAVILASFTAEAYLQREGLDGPEFSLLLLLAAAGGSVMAGANDLIVMFIGIEVLSLAVYVLAAMHARRISSQESGLKYFLLGGFASAFLLYGIALTYGATGTTSLLRVQSFLAERVLTDDGLLLGGLALLLVGFAFKVGAVPFHMWTPDVYQGAPSPVTGFMAAAVKTAAFAGMLRVFVVGFASYADLWRPVVGALAIASLVVGAVMSVVQTNVKRMLAYSSIAHAGFVLLGVDAASAEGTAASLFYLAAYTAMALGTFAVVTVVGGSGDGAHTLDAYRGLGRRRPGLALAMSLFLLAQAGTPVTIGFLAKLGVIRAAIDADQWALAIVAMLTAVISTFMYLRIVVAMYFAESESESDDRGELRIPWGVGVTIGVAVIATLVLGVVPGPLEHLSDDALPVLVAVDGR